MRCAGFVRFICAALALAVCGDSSAAAASVWPPLQLELRVPFEPTAFPSAGRSYLVYELQLRNFGRSVVTVDRVEVFDADSAAAPAVVTLEAKQLESSMQPLGSATPADAAWRRQLSPGSSAVLYAWLSFPVSHVPARLRHVVTTGGIAVEGAVIGTHHTRLRVLGPPLKGRGWVADSGPDNDSYHRRGMLILDGVTGIDRRYAIDWTKPQGDAVSAVEGVDNRSYQAYGEEVLGVASGRVVSAIDGIPDNVPRRDGFRPAVPISMDTLAGNTITLDVGGGTFAYYMHLQPGSLRVKAGDRVRRGAVLARVGNSGDSRRPHLHFEVTNSPRFLAGEGVPYLIDEYRVTAPDVSPQVRRAELPLKDMVVDFSRR